LKLIAKTLKNGNFKCIFGELFKLTNVLNIGAELVVEELKKLKQLHGE
jgi:hypothetical protein